MSTDSRKTYSVNKYKYTGSSSYSFDWGGWENPLGGGGGRNGKDPKPILIFSNSTNNSIDFYFQDAYTHRIDSNILETLLKTHYYAFQRLSGKLLSREPVSKFKLRGESTSEKF